jgi:sec-independent protein translocase protein TatA
MASVSAPLAFIDGLGGMEMLLVFVIALLLFGGDKLPGFARSIGKTMREFKKAASGVEEEFKRALDEDERKENAKRLAAPAPTDPIAPHAEDHGYGTDAATSATSAAPTAAAAAPATAAPETPAPSILPPAAATSASDEPLAPAAPAPKPPAAPPAPPAKPPPPADFL